MGITHVKNVRLFDGNNVHQNKSVTFDSDSGTILSVESDGTAPGGAEVIDGSGHTLLPGFIEAHMHAHNLHLPEGGDFTHVLRNPLKCGITTVCDMHSDPETIHKWRAQLKEDVANAKSGKGSVAMSDLKSSLYGATIAGGWPKPIVLGHNPTDELIAIVKTWPSVTPETAQSFIASHKANGADYIKLMQENCCSLALPTNSIPVASLELQSAVVKAAHDAGLLVVGHATARESTEIVLKSGADGLTHTFIDQSPTEDIVPLYKQNNAFVIPTLAVLASLTNEYQDLREKFADIAHDQLGIIDAAVKQNMLEGIGMKSPEASVEYAFETVRMFRKHGIDVVAGTDSVAGLHGTAIGPSMWMELELYVEKCGMSAVEALKSATSVSARRFRFSDRGMVEKGKRADLVLIKGDPTQALKDLWDKKGGKGVVGVWKEGLKAI